MKIRRETKISIGHNNSVNFSNAILIGFNVKPNREAKKLADKEKIEIKFFNIIMLVELLNDFGNR